MRKLAVILLAILCLGAGAYYFATKKGRGVHYFPERRLWKDAAILAINNDLKDPDHLKKRFGEIPQPRGDFDTSEPEWLTADTIVCGDASWLAYRAQCHKEDPQIHDIFIARASDGNWYYSDYHFCKEMMVLAMDGQRESLQQFKAKYFLSRFGKILPVPLKFASAETHLTADLTANTKTIDYDKTKHHNDAIFDGKRLTLRFRQGGSLARRWAGDRDHQARQAGRPSLSAGTGDRPPI